VQHDVRSRVSDPIAAPARREASGQATTGLHSWASSGLRRANPERLSVAPADWTKAPAEAMDFSTGSLFASLIVGSIGMVLFVYGKRQARIPQLASGLLMMVYPYFVPEAGWMLAIAGAMLAGLWLAVRAGY
jgi:hypothetical protein